MLLSWIFIGLSAALCLSCVIPLVRNDYWIFRIFEFPRYQKWWIALILLMAGVIDYHYDQTVILLVAVVCISGAFIYLSILIFPFTVFAPRHIRSNRNPQCGHLRVIVSNVYQYNREKERLIHEIGRHDVDILLFVETDNWWSDQLKGAFGRDYPHQKLHPLQNTYGMLLFSKHPLDQAELRFLIQDEVPSITTVVRHPSGDLRFIAVHPEPPVPAENPKSTERDMELLKVALEAHNESLPVVVAGDLNDVAWSYTTRRFVERSGLLDPRRGRGMYSTFHAKYPWLRWPLDHVFCSPSFSLNRIRCLRYVGSDHLPIYVDLAFPDFSTLQGSSSDD